MKKEELLYRLTGNENPKFLTEREKFMIDKFIEILDEQQSKFYSNIGNAFSGAKVRNFNNLYIAVDVHGTIIDSDYYNNSVRFRDGAIDCLKYLSERTDIVLILYTSSYPEQIENYLKLFKENGINFKYANSNPDAVNTKYGCFFNGKFYFSLMIDDKAAIVDWSTIKKEFEKYKL